MTGRAGGPEFAIRDAAADAHRESVLFPKPRRRDDGVRIAAGRLRIYIHLRTESLARLALDKRSSRDKSVQRARVTHSAYVRQRSAPSHKRETRNARYSTPCARDKPKWDFHDLLNIRWRKRERERERKQGVIASLHLSSSSVYRNCAIIVANHRSHEEKADGSRTQQRLRSVCDRPGETRRNRAYKSCVPR